MSIQFVLRIQKNPICIDLLLTNFKPSFMKNIFETGISDNHNNHKTSAIMKLLFTRESPNTKYYRDHRKFDIDYVSSELSLAN